MGRRLLALPLLLSLVALTACGSTSPDTTGNADRGPFHGVDMRTHPLVLTGADLSARFRSTTGGSTDLSTLGAGRLTLLDFGYTHCPDVCPTTMADLGGALRRLTSAQQRRVQVVFVTTDPGRDSPAVMRSWLANFDGGLARPFVGLTASARRIDAVARTLHILIAPPVRHKNGTITVEHGAETIAFTHYKAQVLWSSDTSSTDYANDISRLLTS